MEYANDMTVTGAENWNQQTRFKFWLGLFAFTHTDNLGKGITESLLAVTMDKIVKQTSVFSLGRAISIKEKTILNSNLLLVD